MNDSITRSAVADLCRHLTSNRLREYLRRLSRLRGMNIYQLFANLVLVLHCAYIAFVVGGFVAVLLGIFFRWSWVRNFWFRTVHLLMMVFVAFESLIDMICPLTSWERWLREAAGQESLEGDFIASWLTRLFFFHFPSWVFTVVYVGFALLILATFVLAPPRAPGFLRRLRGGPQAGIRSPAERS